MFKALIRASWVSSLRASLVFVVTFVAATLVAAHHSDAGLDMQSLVTFDGTVVEYNWRNPHVYIVVDTLDGNGEAVQWSIQTSSTMTVARSGWTPDSLVPGDRVTFSAHPAHDGRPYALLQSIEKEGGIPLGAEYYGVSAEPRIAGPEITAGTTTLEGTWISDGDKLVDYPGGFDGFFRAQMTPNEKGAAVQAAYSELSGENPNSTCVGRPTPAMIISSVLYPLHIEFLYGGERIAIRSEFFDEERIVYMDGRPHPDISQRFQTGHSIGTLEENVLVVDTRNFEDHRSPYQTGVPSGAQKHVVERYELSEDGTRILLDFLLEDPEYFVAPMTHKRELSYIPDHVVQRFDCNVESTRRFVVE
jgi:hypothetical protein